ncbi:MAG TPA: FprA family A-type flavoprotein [Candidatus Hydrogenedentes bacterium]|nr:FprA family A-type flavoprotein [Candidatus Hydrogenedentota bacterium]
MNTLLCEDISWVGAVDWNLRDFHGYETERGATYNAYLIRDEQPTLIDTVKAPFVETLLANIAELTALDEVRWVVCNHAEPDHSSGLPRIMGALPNAALVCTEKCRQTLDKYYDIRGWNLRIIRQNDALAIGKRTLEFIQTPMAHWPESMFTWSPRDRVLFSMDAFGQHYATSERFDDETDLCKMYEEAKIYYANILLPYGGAVSRAMAAAAKLDIAMIAPSHGLVWRGHIPKILEAYTRWSSGVVAPRALILYDSMWSSTALMARAICDGVQAGGAQAQLHHVRRSGLTRIATDALEAAAIAAGSSTLNGGPMPMAAAALSYLQGLKPPCKAALAFGAYGWTKGGAEAVQSCFESLKWDIIRGPIRAQYKATTETLEECRAAGRLLAEKALEAAKY